MKCPTEKCPFDKLIKALESAAVNNFVHNWGAFEKLHEEVEDTSWYYCPYCGQKLVREEENDVNK